MRAKPAQKLSPQKPAQQAQKVAQQPSSTEFDPKPYVRPGISEQEVESLKVLFDTYDNKKLGYLDPNVLKNSLQSLGLKGTKQSIYQLLNDWDNQGYGNISFNDFVYLNSSRVSDTDSRQEIRRLFEEFDDDKVGFLTIQSLRRLVKDLGQNLSEDYIQQLFQRADLDEDNIVTEEQFYNLITHKTFV